MATRDRPEGNPVGRRIIPRRRRGGFTSGGLGDSTVSEGAASSSGSQDDEDLNEQVATEARRPLFRNPSLPRSTADVHSDSPPGLQETANAEDFTPESRLAQVRRRAPEYEREYRLQMLHRLLMRKIPLDEIAQQLQVSIATVHRDKAELTARLRQAARDLNVEELIGHHTGVYDEIAAMAMRAASNANAPLPMRLSAMRTSLAATNDKQRFYQAAGVYDVLRFRRAPGGDGTSDIQRMASVLDELFADAQREERRQSNPNPLGDFSGRDAETMDL